MNRVFDVTRNFEPGSDQRLGGLAGSTGRKADIMPDAVLPGRREVAFSVLEDETT
jgi:hypothetical protein